MAEAIDSQGFVKISPIGIGIGSESHNWELLPSFQCGIET